MPIWFELLILMLVTYSVGIGLGWALWGLSPADKDTETEEDAIL